MHIFSRLTQIMFMRTDLSMFDPHSRNDEDLAAQCREFIQKGRFVELDFGRKPGAVRGNEARAGNDKGGAQVSAG
ncbi:hypothetical protein OF66_1292 [Seleniivibrio woodruffii]|uniref:Uncharacterized protein n=1 Tax=Seleniivibrio woodruffii TaxID=1078050 RepID=A0A4R1K2I4_9BACT|nr:hypothetical protein C8D98_2727 [Seleniivibrio woodruffii]TVZ35677.1 hypothetical protein OF66_1292 [Seleniivibrio woodruffii]